MGLPISIDMLLHGKAVEWERLELKAGWNPLDVLQTVCAFANDFHNLGGGYIVVGVAEEDGCPVLPPSGIASSQLNAIQKEILRLGHEAMQHNGSPPPVFDFDEDHTFFVCRLPVHPQATIRLWVAVGCPLRSGRVCMPWALRS